MCEGSFLPSSFGPHQKHTEFESSLRSYPINSFRAVLRKGWVKRRFEELRPFSYCAASTSDRGVRPTRARAIRSTRGSSASSNAARRYSAANSGLLRSSRIVASSCDVLALRFMMSPLAANTKGGFAAARNLLSRAPRFAPYKPSFLPRPVNVKEERTTASNFGEGPGEIRTHDL